MIDEMSNNNIDYDDFIVSQMKNIEPLMMFKFKKEFFFDFNVIKIIFTEEEKYLNLKD